MTRYYTFRKNVKLLPGQIVEFVQGLGYFAFGKPKPAPTPADITMYDSVSEPEETVFPTHPAAVAGYVNGKWPNYNGIVKKYPAALHLSIDVLGNSFADCLDIETGDATTGDAAPWFRRQTAKGAKKPVFYTQLSNAQTLVNTLAKSGVARSNYRLFTAHYTLKPHRCSSVCGFGFTGIADATQYNNHALGRDLDVSVAAPGFFTNSL